MPVEYVRDHGQTHVFFSPEDVSGGGRVLDQILAIVAHQRRSPRFR
jgi:hypothetical protein